MNQILKKLPKLVKGMKIKLIPEYIHDCDICIQDKMTENKSKTPETKVIKRVRCVKFTDSFNNSLLPNSTYDEWMVLSDYPSNKYKGKPKGDKNNSKIGNKKERQIPNLPNQKEKNSL